MTIPASMPAKVAYIGDGVTVNFPVPFMYFANTDGTKQIKVVLADANGENEVVKVENTDFTITAAGGTNGTLTMNVAPPANYKLTIAYNIPIEQLVDWEEFGRLPSESIEKAFDKVTAILKQLYEVLGRCIQVPISSNEQPNDVFQRFQDQMAELITSANAAIAAAQASADNASASALEAYNYAESVKFGFHREAIAAGDWQAAGDVYKIFFPDVGIISAVYRTTLSGAERMANVDIQDNGTGVTLVAQQPFAGYCLIADAQNAQFVYHQRSASSRWVIQHDLGKYPTVQCLRDDGVVMVGTVKHNSMNNLHIDFTEDLSGIAVLS
ncbi:MAG: hypothetical protein IKN71_05545 [Alphaproteobacteria bacterium]|nr:hypothetical protein [Alphaproteobacteria bacterium]